MSILVCDPVGEEGIAFLKKKGHEVVVRPDISPTELLPAVTGVHALIVRGRTKVTREVIDKGQKLKIIGRSGTGVDTIDVATAQERGIVVVNAPGANAEAVAEHTFSFMLALARSLVSAVTTLKGGKWAKSDFHGMELKGKTLGIVGFGHIGSRVAELGQAFGMQVLVSSHKPPTIGKHVDLPALLAESDFVSLHVPLTPDTKGLLGAREFSSMKKTAYLINTSRGAVIDEAALIDALKNGLIAGAALDVYTKEPLPSESPLLSLPNVLTTPHVAADSREGENRASLLIAEDIDRVLKGEKPLREVHV